MSKGLEAVDEAKTREIEQVKITHDSLLQNLQKEIAQGQVKVKQVESKVSVSIIDKVLFPSGDAEISKAGQLILDRVETILKNTKGKLIRVEGHTDNAPVHPKLQKTFASNWELSAARGSNAVRYLDFKVGIPGNRLRAVAMGPYHPVATNTDAEGRKWNRRVEIALIPDPNYKPN